MSSLLESVRQSLWAAEGTSRKALLGQLHEIIVSLETPEETATRSALYPLQTSAVIIGHDLKIFETLSGSSAKSLKELQHTTGADPTTLGRLLRYMASVGLIRQPGVDLYEANKKSQNLATPEAAIISAHFFQNCSPLFQERPDFLHKTNYQNVTDGKATIFQPAYNTDLDTYTWFSKNPVNRGSLIKYMGLEEKNRGRWLDLYPFEQETQGWDASEPVFVDIGGNVGYYCAKFKERYPKVPGRVILQDLPSTLAHALPTPGVEALGHDVFTPQEIKSAKFYHLGWVLHNWNDDKSREILGHIKSAMCSQSVLLINDMILPETGVSPFAASLDLVMLGACAARERTLREWQDLFDEVGLTLKESHIYNQEHSHGLMSLILPTSSNGHR